MCKFRFIIILFSLFFVQNAIGQIQEPTKFTIGIKPEKYKVGDVVDVIFNAKIDKGWHLYSNGFNPDLGPQLIEFKFKESKSFQLIGGTKAINDHEIYEAVWEGKTRVFENKATLVQQIKILESAGKLDVHINFQTCQDDGVCTQGKKDFEVKLETVSDVIKSKEDTASTQITEITPVEQVNSNDTVKSTSVIDNNISPPVSKTEKPTSLLGFLLAAFLAGLASIFMPCIYPIMPMTVSFFTNQKNGKSKAIFYGICIVIIFALMGLVTKMLGAPFLNFLSTHWIPNLIFFVVFIIFGISLLGAFEIVLPHSTVNKIDRMSDQGGLIGIFFMALTLVVVSFSCTVPFIGSLLIVAAQGEVMRPIYGMFAFGLPFALVFGGLAMFPSLLKSLPKSGGWLNELKAVFGFLEFALALKFLSNIDLAYHFNYIHRNIFLAIWIIFSVVIALYIIGFARLKKDQKVEKLSWQRIFFAGLFFVFSIYMIPGLTNKPLSLLSGILPPIPVETSSVTLSANMRKLPHNLAGYHELEFAQEKAKELNKPILVDFTGYACANCRKMEENVWPEPEILSMLKNDFVIASLYVDDKEVLPVDKQYISKYDNQQIKTVGEKNMDYEISNFNNNAQPYYVILDADGKQIQEPIAYTSKDKFKNFLREGLSKFKK